MVSSGSRIALDVDDTSSSSGAGATVHADNKSNTTGMQILMGAADNTGPRRMASQLPPGVDLARADRDRPEPHGLEIRDHGLRDRAIEREPSIVAREPRTPPVAGKLATHEIRAMTARDLVDAPNMLGAASPSAEVKLAH
jgi:hypothetical protein